MNRPAVAALVVALAATGPAFAQEARSGAALAIDGATLEIGGVRLRLWGVAVEDRATALGWVAWLAIRGLIAGGPVSCTPRSPDGWRCLTAEGSDLASLLVRIGQARATDPYYHYEQELARAASVDGRAVARLCDKLVRFVRLD